MAALPWLGSMCLLAGLILFASNVMVKEARTRREQARWASVGDVAMTLAVVSAALSVLLLVADWRGIVG